MAEILHFEILRKHGQTNTQTNTHTNKQTNTHTNRHGHYNTSPSPYGGRGNKSIETGIVPDIMQLAKVIPIYKAKNKDEFSNYRPISLLPALSKIMEKVIHKRVCSFLEHNDMLYMLYTNILCIR